MVRRRSPAFGVPDDEARPVKAGRDAPVPSGLMLSFGGYSEIATSLCAECEP